MAHDVFLCYTTRDKPVADAVCHALEAADVRCWVASRDILPGRSWSGAIINAIAQSRLFIIIFSSEANRSPQVLREVERAVNKGIPIIPFRIEPVVPSEDLEYFLSAPHWLDALSPPLEAHLQRLVESARVVLGSPLATALPAAGHEPAVERAHTHSLARASTIARPQPARSTALSGTRTREQQRGQLGARVAHMRATVARWRRVALGAGLLGLLIYGVFFHSMVPVQGIAVAAHRDEAVFAGRRYLAELGGPSGRERILLTDNDSAFRFLQAVPNRRANRPAAWPAYVWRWHVLSFDRTRNEAWTVAVGSQRLPVAFSRMRSDTATGANLTAEQARPIAEAALRVHAPSFEQLRLLSDSTVRLGKRTDHIFTWARQGAAIPGPRGDSARQQVQVQVTGDEVSAYREFLALPASFHQATAARGARTASVALAWLVISALIIFGFVLAVRRGRTDELQWETILLLTAALFPLIAVGVWSLFLDLTIPAAPTADAWYGTMIGGTVAAVFALTVWLFCSAAAESIAQEVRPRMVAGIHELARGRVRTPEFATATLVGYPIAFVLLGASALVYTVAQQFFHVPQHAALPNSFEAVFPTLHVLIQGSAAVATTLFLWFCISVIAYVRAPATLVLAFPALLYALFSFGVGAPALDTAVGFLTVLALATVTWHAGVITAMIVLFVMFATPEVGALLRSGNGDFVAAGLLGLLVLFVPGVLGILAHRRLA